MDKIRYDFEQAIRQIHQVNKLHENAQECLAQAKHARTMMMELGDGEVVRLLTEALEERIRQGEKLCERMEHLHHALQKNLRLFENTETELIRSVRGIGEEANNVRFRDEHPMISLPQCLIGDLRFSDVMYPDFLSRAAQKYFASTQ